MAITKKKRQQVVYKYIIYLYLLIFPLGQLLRMKISFDSYVIRIQPIDLVVGISAVLYMFGQLQENKVFMKFLSFLLAAAFSLTLSLTLFSSKQVLVGSLYLFRLFAYSTFFLLIIKSINEKLIRKSRLINYLIVISFVIGVFGWVQYLVLPDVRFLKIFGWDDHYFRIVGSFFDPAFISILLVFGLLISVVYYLKRRRYLYLSIILFLLISVLFTYSRAAYLALAAGIIVILYIEKRLRLFFYISIVFGLLLLFLPRPSSEGVKLERIHSILQKRDNYIETLQIVKMHPVFGVGYNNLCSARLKYVGDIGYGSHSCSGSDSSILLILSTTGIVGLLIFVGFIKTVYVQMRESVHKDSFLACATALFIHSLFVNSLFYPWVLGYLAILYAVAFVSRERVSLHT